MTENVMEEKKSIDGLSVQISNGAKVTVCLMNDGGAFLEFDRDGNKTPLCLSAEAMNMVTRLWTQLTWDRP